MIQGGVIPAQFFQEDAFPNFVNLVGIPKIGELSHNTAASAASTASNAYTGFRTYLDNFRTGLSRYVQNPDKYPSLNRFGEIWSNFVSPSAGVIPSRSLVTPGLLRGNSGTASAGAASSAASGGLAKR